MARPWYQYTLGGGGLAIYDDYNRETKPETVAFNPMQFDRERADAREAAFGSGTATARGQSAQLETLGLGNVPGLQMAAVNQARNTNLNHLGNMYKDIGNRETQQMGLVGRINEARRMMAQEKDEARRARWGAVIKTLTAMAVTAATGGFGAPALATAGTGVEAGTTDRRINDIPFGGK
jgi:hypothetical protein